MSPQDWFGDEQAHEEESFARPFLGKVIKAEQNELRYGAEVELPVAGNRPYLLTGGRTGGGDAGIGIETLLYRDRGARLHQRYSAELTMILNACDSPVAVAEVAARVGLPIGVVQVLAGDLVAAGVLQRSSSSLAQADDVALLERLIHGVAAL